MREKVLIIDDDHDIAHVTTLWVRSAGYDAQIARDGLSGLTAALSYQPDLVLLDIMMPGIDGFEVSRRFKENPTLADIPIIFLSAKVQETARHEAFSVGAKYFLSKPYDGRDLIKAVAAALPPVIGPSELNLDKEFHYAPETIQHDN